MNNGASKIIFFLNISLLVFIYVCCLSLRYRIYHFHVLFAVGRHFLSCISSIIYKAEFHLLVKDMCVLHLILNKPSKLSYFPYSDFAGLKHSLDNVIFLTNICNCKNLIMTFLQSSDIFIFNTNIWRCLNFSGYHFSNCDLFPTRGKKYKSKKLQQF
jgi:hypothetical protein